MLELVHIFLSQTKISELRGMACKLDEGLLVYILCFNFLGLFIHQLKEFSLEKSDNFVNV